MDQSGMEHESMHGIIVTPEIVTMMTPSQMGKGGREIISVFCKFNYHYAKIFLIDLVQ